MGSSLRSDVTFGLSQSALLRAGARDGTQRKRFFVNVWLYGKYGAILITFLNKQIETFFSVFPFPLTILFSCSKWHYFEKWNMISKTLGVSKPCLGSFFHLKDFLLKLFLDYFLWSLKVTLTRVFSLTLTMKITHFDIEIVKEYYSILYLIAFYKVYWNNYWNNYQRLPIFFSKFIAKKCLYQNGFKIIKGKNSEKFLTFNI